jgi:ribose/xylose/arabinose/galactoside ABC-type transport system permease subunit
VLLAVAAAVIGGKSLFGGRGQTILGYWAAWSSAASQRSVLAGRVQ